MGNFCGKILFTLGEFFKDLGKKSNHLVTLLSIRPLLEDFETNLFPLFSAHPNFFDERHQEKEMMVWLKLVFNK